MSAPLKPAVFLDRDGTINVDVGYLHEIEQMRLLPGAIPALRLLQEHYQLVVVTNQSGIARGLLSEEKLHRIHRKMLDLLAQGGVSIQGIYYCPHHPDYGEPPYRCECQCRKPFPTLFKRAAQELGLDPALSWAVGDKLRDCLGPMQLGSRGILLSLDDEQVKIAKEQYPQMPIVDDILAAAHYILEHDRLSL